VVGGYSNVGKIHGQNMEQLYDYKYYRDFKPVALMTPFRFKPRGEDVININIANLPISLSWFAKFMDDMYFKKKVEHVPIGQIFRDLLEIGISNMLSEVCFNNYIEKKLMFRVTAHKGTKSQYDQFLTLKKASGNEGVNEKDIKTTLGFPLFSSQIDDLNNDTSDYDAGGSLYYETEDQNYYSYIYIHTQDPLESGPDYQDKLFDQVANGTIPLIRNIGADTKPYLYVENLSWSKVENKYERERRYFNSADFNPYVLGNVYNCSIKTTYMIPFLYPGMIVYIDPYLGPDSVFENKRESMNSELVKSAIKNTIGYQIGLTGFYLITKVKHSLKKSDGNTSITAGNTEISCKNIIGMDAMIETQAEANNKCDEYVGLSEKILTSAGTTMSTAIETSEIDDEEGNTVTNSTVIESEIKTDQTAADDSGKTPNQETGKPKIYGRKL
jgi:hypothetical protein